MSPHHRQTKAIGGPHNTREAPGPFLQDEQTAPALLEPRVSAWRERTLGEHTPEPSSTSTIHPSPSQAMTLKVALKHTETPNTCLMAQE